VGIDPVRNSQMDEMDMSLYRSIILGFVSNSMRIFYYPPS